MKISDIERDLKAAIAAISLASFAAGSAGTYFVFHKRLLPKLQAEYDTRLAKELEDTKKFYEKVHKTGGFADPEALAQELIDEPIVAKVKKAEEVVEDPEMKKAMDALATYTNYGSETPEKKTLELHNIFRDAVRVDPEEIDEEQDDPTVPYIISKDVFLSGDKEYDQLTYTYYMDDGVLADESDKVVEDEEKTIGEGNLQRFGYKSGDNNVVYVRNDRLELDFEILRSRGNYASEVLGFQHSERRPGVMKFRGDFG